MQSAPCRLQAIVILTLEPERLKKPIGHHQKRSPEMEGLFTRDAQAGPDEKTRPVSPHLRPQNLRQGFNDLGIALPLSQQPDEVLTFLRDAKPITPMIQ